MSPAGGNRRRTTCREVWFNVCVRVVIKVRLIRIAKSMLMLEFFDVSLREKIIFHKDIFLHIQALTEPDLIYVFFCFVCSRYSTYILCFTWTVGLDCYIMLWCNDLSPEIWDMYFWLLSLSVIWCLGTLSPVNHYHPLAVLPVVAGAGVELQ